METANLFIKDIFNKWGIDLPNDEFLLEYLQKEYPDNFFFIDRFPFAAGMKHGQVDIFYQNAMNKKADNKTYIDMEKKYIKTIILLWLYNEVFLFSDIKDIAIKKAKKKIDYKYYSIYKNIIKKDIINENNPIRQKEELEMYVQLATRDLINVIFYFKGYEMIIVPLWSCYGVYLNDISVKNTLEKIVNTEGLYLRNLSNT